MKKIITMFLGALLLVGIVFPTNKVLAQSDVQTTQQNKVSIEAQLNTAQKELIVLLNKKIANLKVELNLSLEKRLRYAQIQVIALLQKKVANLQIELANKSK